MSTRQAVLAIDPIQKLRGKEITSLTDRLDDISLWPQLVGEMMKVVVLQSLSHVSDTRSREPRGLPSELINSGTGH